MRKLALAATAATILAGTVPASAQSFYAGVGVGPGWGYGDWSGWGHHPYAFGYGPGDGSSYGGRVGTAADAYVYADRPRYRTRRVVRTTRVERSLDPAFGAYAYSPAYGYGGYGYAAPYVGPRVSAAVGFGPSWGYRWW